jgi:hypothetical protein
LDGLTTDAGRACVDWGVDEHAAANPNIVIVKANIRIMRAGCAIIEITLTYGINPPYGMEP